MSRLLLQAFSCTRIPCPTSQLRMTSSSKNCPPAYPPNTCDPKNVPHITPVCTTNPSKIGRTDEEFDKCIADNIANPTPACTTPSLATFPCEKQPWPKNRGKAEPFVGKSAWETVECCNQKKCAVTPLRHDIVYLKPEEKCHRRTWFDFACVCLVEEDRCAQPKFAVAEPEERPRVIKKEVIIPKKFDICEPEERPRGQINKAPTANQPPAKINPCPKIRLPGCKRAAEKLKCSPPVAPKCCQKRCTQYPAFSECCRATSDKIDNTECGCLRALSQCKAFNRAKWLLEN